MRERSTTGNSKLQRTFAASMMLGACLALAVPASGKVIHVDGGAPSGGKGTTWAAAVNDLQAAIDCPSFHSEHFPSSFFPRESYPKRVVVEGRMPEATIKELRKRGHDVVVEEDWSLGRVSAASLEDGVIKAAANPRGMQGYAIAR